MKIKLVNAGTYFVYGKKYMKGQVQEVRDQLAEKLLNLRDDKDRHYFVEADAVLATPGGDGSTEDTQDPTGDEAGDETSVDATGDDTGEDTTEPQQSQRSRKRNPKGTDEAAIDAV